MNVLGVITEYNPFHNGHLLHLQQSKQITSADYTIAIMSSNFVQRGEPAIVNKWTRTAMALAEGLDLIIELPVMYAISSAEFFAHAAIKLLDSLGIINCVCFGSETGEIEPLNIIANILAEEPKEYKQYLKQNLSTGVSFPSARTKAISNFIALNRAKHQFSNQSFQLDSIDSISHFTEDIMTNSNNILAIEYLKAIKRLNSKITPFTIKRQANLYNEENLTGLISSATSIRRHFREYDYHRNKMLDISKLSTHNDLAMPPKSFNIIKEDFKKGKGPVFIDSFENILFAVLRKLSAEDIRKYPGVNEGLENRIKKAANISGHLNELIDNICTKRYTRTRVQRIISNILLGITDRDFQSFNINNGPQYIRVLGFNKKGRDLLSLINKKSSLPVIVKTADYKDSANMFIRNMLEIESFATDVYVLGYANSQFRFAGQEFTENVVIVT